VFDLPIINGGNHQCGTSSTRKPKTAIHGDEGDYLLQLRSRMAGDLIVGHVGRGRKHAISNWKGTAIGDLYLLLTGVNVFGNTIGLFNLWGGGSNCTSWSQFEKQQSCDKVSGEPSGIADFGGRANGRFAVGGFAPLARLAIVDSLKSPSQSEESSSLGGESVGCVRGRVQMPWRIVVSEVEDRTATIGWRCSREVKVLGHVV
jgi:hypothetical protein